MRRILMLMLVTAMAFVAVPASAQYGPGNNQPAADVVVSDASPAPGQVITVRVVPPSDRHPDRTFRPSSRVTIIFQSTPRQLGEATVAADSTVTAQVRIPTDAEPGPHSIIVQGTSVSGQPLSVSQPITVEGTARDRGRGQLPRTGSADTTGDLARGGVVLLAVGAGLVLVGRSRRRRAA